MRLFVLALWVLAFATPAAANGDGVDSGNIAPGESWSYTFTEQTQFAYHCHPHPWMMGMVTVLESADPAPQNHTVRIVQPETDTSTWGYGPAMLTVRSGDTVTWVNNGTTVHTVTQEAEGHGHDDHGDAHAADEEDEDSPAPIPLLLVALLATVLARGRLR